MRSSKDLFFILNHVSCLGVLLCVNQSINHQSVNTETTPYVLGYVLWRIQRRLMSHIEDLLFTKYRKVNTKQSTVSTKILTGASKAQQALAYVSFPTSFLSTCSPLFPSYTVLTFFFFNVIKLPSASQSLPPIPSPRDLFSQCPPHYLILLLVSIPMSSSQGQLPHHLSQGWLTVLYAHHLDL